MSDKLSPRVQVDAESLLQEGPVPVFIYSREDLCVLAANSAALALYGYDRSELAELSVRDLMHPEDFPRVAEHIRNQGELPAWFDEVRHRHRSGSTLYMQLHALPLLYEGVKARMVLLHDVTAYRQTLGELKMAEEKAHASEERFRSLVNALEEIVFTIDMEQRYTGFYGRWFERTGNDPGQLVGKMVEDFVGPENASVHEQANARALAGASLVYEWQADLGDGLRHFQTSLAPIRNEEGVIIGAVGIGRDVTEQKLAEQALWESEEKFRKLVEHSPAGIYIIQDGLVVYCNPFLARLLGYPPEEIVGRDLLNDFIAPEDRETVRDNLERRLAGEVESVQYEVRILCKDGGSVYLWGIGTKTQYQGRPAIIGTALDVTERRAMVQELVDARIRAEEMSRLKSAFLANMSHEIRTPLTSIIGFSEVLADELSSRNQEYARLIQNSGQRLLETLNSVLDLAQLEGHSLKLHFEKFDLVSQVADVLEMFQGHARDRHLFLRLDAEVDQIQVRLDKGAVIRILRNVVSNAIKFTNQGGVNVHLREEGDNVVIQVEDTGVGISAEFLPHVFDEFQQESTGFAREYEGNGLGLTITRRLVDLLGGTIGVESTKGQGSRFTVVLPILAGLQTGDPDASRVPRRRARILVVDDDANTRKLVIHMLGKYFDLDAAGNGFEAVQKARLSQYDLILLDINLGTNISGEDVLVDLRILPGYEEIPIIAMTAYALPGDRKRFLQAGFDDYVSKPFAIKQLVEVVRRSGLTTA